MLITYNKIKIKTNKKYYKIIIINICNNSNSSNNKINNNKINKTNRNRKMNSY